MKRNTIVSLFLAAAALVSLCILALYLTWQYHGELSPARSGRVESEADAAIQALDGTAAQTSAGIGEDTGGRGAGGADAAGTASGGDRAENTGSGAPSAPKTDGAGTAANAPEPSVIWVGDSRTLGMRDALDNSDLYIAAAGEGYDWFVKTGLKEMKKAVKAYPELPVVFNFGVNDYDNMDNYMELYESLADEYPGTHFYYLSVNPIDPELCHNITNEEIADFNSHLRALFPDTYLDSYTQIKAKEITPFDGIHYTEDEYRMIYEYAAAEIARKEA